MLSVFITYQNDFVV